MDTIQETITNWIQSTVQQAVAELLQVEQGRQDTILWNRKQVSSHLGISPRAFDEHYRYNDELGFPKELPACRWSRKAVIEWVNEQK